MSGVTYDLSRNMFKPGIQYTFTSTPKGTDIYSINIELLTTAHDIHESINKQAIMDSGRATFEIYMEDLLILDPSYNYQDISINIIIEQLSDDNDLSEAVALYNEIITIKPANAVPNPVTVVEVRDQDEHCFVDIKSIKSDTIDKFKAYYISDRSSRKYKTQVFDSSFIRVDDNYKYYTLDITNLSNGTLYECYLKPYNSIGQGLPCDTFEMKPTNIAHAPTFTKVETIGSIGSFDLSNVKITLNWGDMDAESYAAYTNGIRHVDASNSYAKLRIGTNAAILDASNRFIYTGDYSNKMVDIPITNGQIIAAATINGVTIERNINMVNWFTHAVAITDGGLLQAQIVYDSNLDGGVFGDKPQGELSLVKRAYLQVDASLNDILVEVTKIENEGQAPYFNGSQKFYFNGQIPSLDTANVILTITNGPVTYDVLQVSLNEGIIMHEQSIELQYSVIVTDQYITATLSVPDRNNPVNVYTYDRTFKTSKFKTPSNMAEFEFTGNLGHADPYLHTKLTDVKTDTENKFDSDTLPSNVKWELFNNSELAGTVLNNANYIATGSNVNITNATNVTASYYLKVTKHCELAQSIVDNYNAYGANLGEVVTHDLTGSSGAIYYMQNPKLNGIQVSVNLNSGVQTFNFNGEIASKNTLDAKLTVTYGLTKPIDALQVDLIEGGIIMQNESVDIQYNDIVSDQVITATLTQVDRNGTLNGGSPYTYVSDVSFVTSKFKTPSNKAEFEFTGNLGYADLYLHTVLTGVSNEALNQFDVATASNVKWELFDNMELAGTALNNANYTNLNNVNISYGYDVTASYYLKVTKQCELAQSIIVNYNAYGANLANPLKDNVVSHAKGPIYYMQKPALDEILVNVDVATGKQTFYFNGQIASHNATGATLTVTNGLTTIIDASQVTLHDYVIMDEKSREQQYEDIVTNQVITATLSQVDRNGTLDGANPYTYTSTKTFTTYKFKTPVAPSASLSKNLIANDETFKANLINVNDNNGYELTNITAQLADDSESGLLADCSGVFDLEVAAPNHLTLAQTIDLFREANFDPDSPYWLDVTKSYRLNDVVYNRYNDVKKSVQLAQSSSVNTVPYFGPAYYVGNPVITDVNINEVDDTISVVVDTHGSTLATTFGGPACTLVLVAKDGLAGYATGDLVGPMGTGVHTSNTIFSSVAKANINDSDFAIVTFRFVLPAVDITNNASCIAIVDATNGHSATVLKNFPIVTSDGLHDSHNKTTN